MSISVSKEAAAYILQVLKNDGHTSTVRVVLEDVRNCGDKSFLFKKNAIKLEDDTEFAVEGLTILCDFREFSQLIGTTIVLVTHNLVPTLDISIPTLHRCGCGLNFTEEKK